MHRELWRELEKKGGTGEGEGGGSRELLCAKCLSQVVWREGELELVCAK